jgi:hypothetical protein
VSEQPDESGERATGFTFFMDISLGQYETADVFRRALADRAEGDRLVMFRDAFETQDIDDVDWITTIAPREWVVLTKDEAIRRNPLERQALEAGRVAAFFLYRGDLTGAAAGRMFVLALPRIRRLLLDYGRPLLAVVQGNGRLDRIEGTRIRKSERPKLPRSRRRRRDSRED